MAQNRNYSSRFEEIFSSSDLVCSGPPTVYQLRTKKQKIGSLTSVTVGEKQETKPNKTILLVGEAGTGKSTLVNALFNYAVGVKFEDEIWFQVVDENKESRDTGSQTSDVIVYQIFGFENQTLPFSLTIIDTPGYGDTQDVEHNIRINQKLMELFQSADGIQEVHTVGLVMKDRKNPVNDRLKYIYDFIKSQFGKDVEKNIVALMTNSQGNPPKNVLQALEAANIKCAKNEKKQPVHSQFDNRQDEERTEDTEVPLENAWRVTERGMKRFTAFLENSPPLQQKVVMEVEKERIRLTACIQNLQERIRFTELNLRDVERTQEALCINKQKMKRSKNFNVLIPETYKGMEPLRDETCGSDTAVICLGCKENCHYPGCTKALNAQQCEVMINGKCTSCTNKCPASEHVKKNWQFVIRTQMVERNKEALKQQYKQKQEAGEKKVKLSERLEKEKTKLRAEKRQLVNEAYRHSIKLSVLVKNDDSIDDSISNYVILDFLIKKMKGQGDEEKLQELEEIYNQMDQATRTSQKHRMAITSSNQEALISESVQIHEGPPAVYQVIPKKEMMGTLSRLTVGEEDEMKTNKTILLVGETGTGKSTLINALFNFAVGVKFEDNVWFQIVEEDKKNYQTESQTSDVIVYQIFGFEGQTLPFSLTIIDTPGYGSTRGIEEDNSVSRRLLDLFRSEDGVHQINAVGLVMKASDNRLSDRLRYIFDSVTSLFGNDLERNIVTLITHSDGKTPENVLQALEAADIKCSKDEMNQPVHFMFNNQQRQQRYTEKDINASKYSWDFTNEEMGHLRDFLKNTKPQPLKTTVEVLNERIRLTACIQNLKERIELNEQKQNEIKQIKEAYNKHEAEMKKNKNFTIDVDEPYKETETIRGGKWGLVFLEGAVTCNICKENCHYPGCTMARKPAHCNVMKWGRCTICTNKCPETVHVKENWKYVTKTRKVPKTLNDVKAKYEKNKAECEKKSTLLENLEKETSKLTTERWTLLDEAYSCVTRLEDIALNINSASTFVHLDFLIVKIKEKGEQKKVEVLEKLKNRMNEGLKPPKK
ncbi:uncharacterized protein LOC102229642 [Xiphophorus maculatus]|uniref:Uncharacterized LOC102229642 n=1 Tax=Xiphophorus maculatus TaxID=8083 RepID=M4AZP6_XIPMA|nr:uncharacterized protein LOC102229642 [Xiphophorus maculatus]